MEDKIISYGGQAVIEGVMMRGQKGFAIARRAPDGSIAVHKENLAAVYRSKITKIPFLRGVILLWDALGLGMRALTVSANTQTGKMKNSKVPHCISPLVLHWRSESTAEEKIKKGQETSEFRYGLRTQKQNSKHSQAKQRTRRNARSRSRLFSWTNRKTRSTKKNNRTNRKVLRFPDGN